MLNIKRLTGVFISALLITATVQSAFAGSIFDNFKNMLSYTEQKVSVKLDGKNITFPDVQPYVNEDNRTLVPVRFVSEAMGCDVKWEEANQMVIITKSPKRILLQIGQNWAIVNDTKTDVRKEFDTKAVLKDDRTMVPLRFVSETLGAGVAWDEKNNTVILRSDGTVDQVDTATPIPSATPVATPSKTISPTEYTSPRDRFKGKELTDPTAREIYNFGYYVFGSNFLSSGYGIGFTDRPDGLENFSVAVSPYAIDVKMQYITPLTKEMLYKTLKVLYPDSYEKYYAFFINKLTNKEYGNRWENIDGLTFYTQYSIVPYDTLYITIRPAKD